MGVLSTREKCVLKLVHPGRYVEIHTEPITAAEVMKKNPRHRVARPDVFKFPWIVVRPESVLTPGSVFYIVPDRTIYRLLKAKGNGQSNQAFSQQNQSPRNHDQYLHRISRHTSCYRSGGMLPKHRNYDQSFQNVPCNGPSSPEEDSDDGPVHINRYQIESWPGKFMNNNRIPLYSDPESPADSSDEITTFHRINNRTVLPEIRNGDRLNRSSEQAVKLKSCLRKPDSIRKSLKLKVTFVLPNTSRRSPEQSPNLQPNVHSSWFTASRMDFYFPKFLP